jgi:DNA-binding transcriptional MerR regulator
MAGVLKQLDLFGFPVEPTPSKKKEKAPKEPKSISDSGVTSNQRDIVLSDNLDTKNSVAPKETIAENVFSGPSLFEFEETILTSITSVAEEPAVIYQDKSIAVKIKKKANPKPKVKTSPSKIPSKRGRKSFRDMDSEIHQIEIPDEETLQQKLYYSISEVASWFKVNTSLLRYWENEFDILQPRKTRKGDRLFRAEDIKNLQLIYFLLRQRKFSIEGAKNYLKNNKSKADMQSQLMQSLTKFKSFLLELKSSLAVS